MLDTKTLAWAEALDPALIAKTASQRHVQSVIEDLVSVVCRLSAEIERLAQQRAELDALREQKPVTAQFRVDGCSTWHSFTVSDARRWLANPWAGIEEVRLLYAAPVDHATQESEVLAWAHPDGRVVPAETMKAALRDGGASASSLRGYTIALRKGN